MYRERIIKAKANERQLITAGPGVGKTSMIMSRLEHLFSDGLSTHKVLVFSFSNAAVNEVKSRLIEEESINSDDSIIVSTIDSFVAQELNSSSYQISDPTPSGFEYRIQAFSELLNDDRSKFHFYRRWSSISHLIVDELQDTIGCRLSLLEQLITLWSVNSSFGFTLFGDRKQAIYGCFNDSKLRLLADNIWTEDYINISFRFSDALIPFMVDLRQLRDSCRIEEFSRAKLETISLDQLDESVLWVNEKSVAILTHDNLQAQQLCAHLASMGICSEVLTASGVNWPPKLPYYPYVTSEATTSIENIRVYLSELRNQWTSLLVEEFSRFAAGVFSLEKFLEYIAKVPDYFAPNPSNSISISTIHNAKGREFDTVFVPSNMHAKSPTLNYVGLTRAKEKLALFEFSQLDAAKLRSTWIAWDQDKKELCRRTAKSNRPGFVFEEALDIDLLSFLKLKDETPTLQSDLEKSPDLFIGKEVVLVQRTSDLRFEYRLLESDRIIGLASDILIESLKLLGLAGHKQYVGLRVSSVCTINGYWLNKNFPVNVLSRVPCHKDFQFVSQWYGLRLNGILKPGEM